ncbi:MAG: antitermination regulator [Frankiales bacterium]|nr:antitermination regulator [Frankiales bacterium]
MPHTEPGGIREDPTSELTLDFSLAARTLFSAGSVEDTLARVVGLAVSTIEGCDFAGIFLVDGIAVTTPVHSDPLVLEIDGVQQRHNEGPCLNAIREGLTFYAEDLADDTRWPRFGAQATATGVRSVLALPLAANRTFGALNLYARYPSAFGVIDRARGQLLAALAALALSSAQAHEDEERRATNLHAALDTREMIGQAQGILMERERISADQAFAVLRRASQHLNVKLREVAQALVDTGQRPDIGAVRTARPPEREGARPETE